MKWFKHDSDANMDAKLKRVRMKYGLEGYGLYFYCLELIASGIDENNLTLELEHDAEIISFDTGIHFERVQEMISYMVNLGLFENSNGVITCFKLLKRLDQSMTSSQKMRELIAKAKEKNHDGVMINPDLVMQDKNRKEENRKEENRKEENRKEKKAQAPLLPAYINPDIWAAFLCMRKSIRKPLTEKAAELVLKKLDGFRLNGTDPNTSLENSILNSWQSVFEPDSKNKKSELTTHNIAAAQEFVNS